MITMSIIKDLLKGPWTGKSRKHVIIGAFLVSLIVSIGFVIAWGIITIASFFIPQPNPIIPPSLLPPPEGVGPFFTRGILFSCTLFGVSFLLYIFLGLQQHRSKKKKSYLRPQNLDTDASKHNHSNASEEEIR